MLPDPFVDCIIDAVSIKYFDLKCKLITHLLYLFVYSGNVNF